MKICGNLPQTHPDRHNMKKLFSDPPDLGRSQEKIYTQLDLKMAFLERRYKPYSEKL